MRFGARRETLLGWAALVAVYFFWSTTYLAIRVGVQTLPPLLLASGRYVLPGAVVFALTWRQHHGGSPRAWLAAAVCGLLMMFAGSGFLTVAEQTLPAGVAALFIATVPLWMAVLDAIVQRRRIPATILAGIVIGFAGTGVLLAPSGGDSLDPRAVALALLAALGWASGSIFSRGSALPKQPFAATGMEMLAGGVWLAIGAGVTGEIHPVALSAPAIGAFAWLVIFGSIVGFSAYVYALRVLPLTAVSTYAFVNPALAVLLSWWLLGESVGAHTLIALALIAAGVILILQPRRSSSPRPDYETVAAAS